jgi:hypothetical protein
MKTRKQFSTKKMGSFATAKLQAKRLCLLAIIMLCIVAALAVIGCKQDEPTPTPQAQPSVTIDGKTIPVYKTAGVSDADFATTVENLKTAISLGLNPGVPAYIAANTTRIEIVVNTGILGTAVTLNTGVLRIWANITAVAIAGNLNSIYAASL